MVKIYLVFTLLDIKHILYSQCNNFSLKKVYSKNIIMQIINNTYKTAVYKFLLFYTNAN